MTQQSEQLTDEQLGEMSDEDFLKLGPSQVEAAAKQLDQNTVAAYNEQNPDAKLNFGPTQEEEVGDPNAETDAEAEAAQAAAVENNTADPANTEETGSSDETNSTSVETSGETEETGGGAATGEHKKDEASAESDASAEAGKQVSDTDQAKIAAYDLIFAPFKANGMAIQAQSPEDVISLMQMGANYHKKMSEVKPARQVLKLLEDNGLTDLKDINFLIDIHKRNPEAITKLLKDSEIDPLNLDTKSDSTYTPTSRTVSEAELALEDALVSIQSRKGYAETIQIITKQWDDTSRRHLAQNPSLITTINDHVESGIYATVSQAVQYQRSLGNLVGLTDFQAYDKMGEQLYKEGKLGPPAQTTPTDTTTSTSKTEAKTLTQQETEQAKAERLRRKKAATHTTPRKTPAKILPTGQSILAMSDEEFAKLDPKQLGARS